jgi:DNA-binding MarR family transcriptional regulator
MTEIKQQCVFYQAKGYNPNDSVGYLMKQIISMVSQEIERQLAHTDLTNAQWVPLFKLYMGQASTVAELARHCNLDAGAMTRLLDRLEAKGLCKRVRSETDRRVVNIELTPTGTQAASEIPEILSGVQNAHLAGFSETEFQALHGYLQRILGNAQAIASQGTNTPSNPAESDAAS